MMNTEADSEILYVTDKMKTKQQVEKNINTVDDERCDLQERDELEMPERLGSEIMDVEADSEILQTSDIENNTTESVSLATAEDCMKLDTFNTKKGEARKRKKYVVNV
ncbi:uncharacterized protein LOC126742799 [Anthonomus grandis grandis]|uniref:uncharacterized protein LOC126742799 n=1 Tax=Anthonomus grandis grandis TaxID=2921223 RepID=UPI0021652F60|nr:uncharacterized protein LOC126742799 [Anthonomus grandis grandis]